MSVNHICALFYIVKAGDCDGNVCRVRVGLGIGEDSKFIAQGRVNVVAVAKWPRFMRSSLEAQICQSYHMPKVLLITTTAGNMKIYVCQVREYSSASRLRSGMKILGAHASSG